MTRLLCTGDLHIGAGADLGRKPGDRLRDQEQVWTRILELAVDENVAGVLFAGDAFEGPTPTSEHYAAFLRPIERVLQGRIPMLAVSGNGKHDSAMRETNALKVFDGLGIQVVTQPDVVRFAGCAVACLPWVHPGRLVARMGVDVGRDEVNAVVGELLVDVATALRLQCDGDAPGAPTILLGHWSVSGSSLPNGLRVADLREPVIPLAGLESADFDVAVFGHIHQPQMIGTGLLPIADPNAIQLFNDPGTLYVGSPMPLNFGEAASAHGVWIIDLPGGSSSMAPTNGSAPRTEQPATLPTDPGSSPGSRSSFHAIESRPLVTIDGDLTGLSDIAPEMVYEPVPDGAIVRVRYRATGEQHRSFAVGALREMFLDSGAAVVRVQADVVREDRARVEHVDEQLDELAALDLWIKTQDIEPGLATRMRAKTAEFLGAAA